MLKIVDRPGVISVAAMRGHFEQAIHATPVLRDSAKLDAVEADGTFSHYADRDTDNVWVGFALGLRGAEQIARHKMRHNP